MKSKCEIREISKKIRLKEKKRIGQNCINSERFSILISKIEKKYKISNIGIYYPIKNEISPLKIFEISKFTNFEVCFPKIIETQDELIFEKCDDLNDLVRGIYGTFELNKTGIKVIPEIIFVPLLAFDTKFNRLGYGKGFYDKTLCKIRKLKKIFVIGLGYDKQFIDKLPVEDHDQKLDFIMTEKRILSDVKLK